MKTLHTHTHTHTQAPANYKLIWLMMVLIGTSLFAQAQTQVVFEEWAKYKGVQEFFYKNVTVTDASNNVFVAGATLNGDGDYDLLISKYDRNGVHLWSDTIVGPGGGHDIAAAIAIDSNNDILVCGTISASGTEGNNILLVKYDTDGFEYWRYSHDYGGNHEIASDLCIDANNNVFLTGGTYDGSTPSDIITIRVNNDGTLEWEEVFDYNHLYDLGVKIAVSGTRVVVTGAGQMNQTSFKILAMSYLRSDGTLSGYVATGSGINQGIEEVSDLFIDENENVYIAGSIINPGNGYDFKLIKLDEDLDEVWVRTWDGEGLNDYGRGVKVAPNGDVYICGTSSTTDNGDDMVLIKYNSSGTQQWVETYNGNYRGDDRAETLEYHPDGYIYVAGSSYVVSNMDYLTLKYNTAGDLLWEINYNSPYNKNDRATNMAIDTDGNIIVTGQCERDSVLKTYYAVKYVEKEIPISLAALSINEGGPAVGHEENLGQICNENQIPVELVKFSSIWQPLKYHFLDDKLSFVFASENTADSLAPDTLDRVDLTFEKITNGTKVRAFNQQSFFRNLYTSQINFHNGTQILERVRNYRYMIYESIWNGCDLMVYSDSAGINILLMAESLSSLGNVEFSLNGIDTLTIEDDDLHVQAFLSSLQILKPESFDVDLYGNLMPNNDVIEYTITLGKINLNCVSCADEPKAIRIKIPYKQPILMVNDYTTGNLLWSTYFGGEAVEVADGMEVQSNGEISIIYGTHSPIFQTWPAFEGDIDIEMITQLLGPDGGPIYRRTEIAQFDVDHQLNWITVISNLSNHVFGGKIERRANDIYFAGWTTGLPLTMNADQTNNNNSLWYNAYVGRCNSVWGALEWLTYLGGGPISTANAQVRGLHIHEDKVYVIGVTSFGNFPLENFAGGYNQDINYPANFGGYVLTGYITCYNTNSNSFNKIWSTYFGGDGNENITQTKILNNRLYIGGTTQSTPSSTIYTSPSEWNDDGFELVDNQTYYFLNETNNLSTVPFLSEFDLSTHRLTWSVRGFGNVFDIIPNGPNTELVVAFGANPSFTDFPLIDNDNYFDDTNSGQMLALFSNFSPIWSTMVPSVNVNSIILGGKSDIYLGGVTSDATTSTDDCTPQSTPAFPICNTFATAFFDETFNADGSNQSGDGAVLAFNYNGEMIWSTYFGGNQYFSNPGGTERIIKLALDGYGKMYAYGNTFGGTFPVIPLAGAYNQMTHGGILDGFISKFDISQFYLTTPVEELSTTNATSVSIFPNPNQNTDEIFVHISIGLIQDLQIFDMRGVIVFSSTQANKQTVSVSIPNLSIGMYIIQITDNDDNMLNTKFIRY